MPACSSRTASSTGDFATSGPALHRLHRAACDFSWREQRVGIGNTLNFVIEDCTIMFNNYAVTGRWHDGGMKNIPATSARPSADASRVQLFRGVWFTCSTWTRESWTTFPSQRGRRRRVRGQLRPNVIAATCATPRRIRDRWSGIRPPSNAKMARGEAGDQNERKYVPNTSRTGSTSPTRR